MAPPQVLRRERRCSNPGFPFSTPNPTPPVPTRQRSRSVGAPRTQVYVKPDPGPLLLALERLVRRELSEYLDVGDVLAIHERDVVECCERDAIRTWRGARSSFVPSSIDSPNPLPLRLAVIYVSTRTLLGGTYELDIPSVVVSCVEEIWARAGSSVATSVKGLDPAIFLSPPHPDLSDQEALNLPLHALSKVTTPALFESLSSYFASLTRQEYALIPSSLRAVFSEFCVQRPHAALDVPNASTSVPPRPTRTQVKTAQALLRLLPTPHFALIMYMMTFLSQVPNLDREGWEIPFTRLGWAFAEWVFGGHDTNLPVSVLQPDGATGTNTAIDVGDRATGEMMYWFLVNWGEVSVGLFRGDSGKSGRRGRNEKGVRIQERVTKGKGKERETLRRADGCEPKSICFTNPMTHDQFALSLSQSSVWHPFRPAIQLSISLSTSTAYRSVVGTTAPLRIGKRKVGDPTNGSLQEGRSVVGQSTKGLSLDEHSPGGGDVVRGTRDDGGADVEILSSDIPSTSKFESAMVPSSSSMNLDELIRDSSYLAEFLTEEIQDSSMLGAVKTLDDDDSAISIPMPSEGLFEGDVMSVLSGASGVSSQINRAPPCHTKGILDRCGNEQDRTAPHALDISLSIPSPSFLSPSGSASGLSFVSTSSAPALEERLLDITLSLALEDEYVSTSAGKPSLQTPLKAKPSIGSMIPTPKGKIRYGSGTGGRPFIGARTPSKGGGAKPQPSRLSSSSASSSSSSSSTHASSASSPPTSVTAVSSTSASSGSSRPTSAATSSTSLSPPPSNSIFASQVDAHTSIPAHEIQAEQLRYVQTYIRELEERLARAEKEVTAAREETRAERHKCLQLEERVRVLGRA
ncbi:hypothetical protein Hypma_012119 [Hypsizygus marmoreus]|uniref:Rho-GAP domain-containing protein n=1 Tax=Hypsizygus marmoreus TaxID=39966 RepID=A0A369JHD6_HYPMA|nr:hypothetical protein Hypma_012119 [Hypsizygus marmoreus]